MIEVTNNVRNVWKTHIRSFVIRTPTTTTTEFQKMSKRKFQEPKEKDGVPLTMEQKRKVGGYVKQGKGMAIFPTGAFSSCNFWSSDNWRHLKPLTQKERDDMVSPFGFYSSLGEDEKVQKLIDDGVDVNSVVLNHGETALHCSVFNRHKSTTLLLLRNGVSPNIGDMSGQTALHHESEAKGDNTDFLELLLSWGADPLAKDEIGQIPSDVTKSEAKRAYLREWEELRKSDVAILDMYRAYKDKQGAALWKGPLPSWQLRPIVSLPVIYPDLACPMLYK